MAGIIEHIKSKIKGEITSPKAIRFSLDLVNLSIDHIHLLEEINKRTVLLEGPLVYRAIQRYEQLWLPLVAENHQQILAAPIDIEWIWHCHLLAPVMYHRDCENAVGQSINHQLLDGRKKLKALEISKSLWNKKYPDEPFDIPLNGEGVSPDFMYESHALSYDLVAAVSRQKHFYYQVSLPHFKDTKYLENSLMRYKKYLYLKKVNPEAFLVPCYDIDLIWHTHQLHPFIYRDETTKLLGKIFQHDDSVNERHPGSRLSKADAFTRTKWKSQYNENFANFGAMYRGDLPLNKLAMVSPGDTYGFSTKSAWIDIHKVKVDGLNGNIDKTKVKIYFACNLTKGPKLTTIRGLQREWNDHEKNHIKFEFDTKQFNQLKVSISQHDGTCISCFGQYDDIASTFYDFLPVLEGTGTRGLKFSEELTVNTNTHGALKVHLHGFIQPPTMGKCLLFLQNGRYDQCNMPLNSERLWGPIPLPKPANNMDENKCSVASHVLSNQMERLISKYLFQVIKSNGKIDIEISILGHLITRED
ncbi:hypothetical protein LOTGIDRAFT_167966 [Lottia gigantea]|uniref:Uncharacterized protein n=1 Tax=Lottia gigantea TaxID=225164 RepID=V4B8Q5_LOTGI|nr:hypothetical protein LOTGIDRAFT_167966 [Lottia gigantea]ESO85179.1 hypothetical protein LOTGIDRAFT_167966 [Lottia gigantea]